MEPKFNRILIKLSGEALMGDCNFGMSEEATLKICEQIKQIHETGVKVAVVVGGGNIFRGAKHACQALKRPVADQIGMLATVMNGIYLQSMLQKTGVKAKVLSSINMPQIAESYMYAKALSAFDEGQVLVLVAGTANPYVTTDSAALLRACELNCDVVLKATQVDGVYDDDPKQNPNAKRFDNISYQQVMDKKLKIMDLMAINMAEQHQIPVLVFNRTKENAIVEAVQKQGVFSVIS